MTRRPLTGALGPTVLGLLALVCCGSPSDGNRGSGGGAAADGGRSAGGDGATSSGGTGSTGGVGGSARTGGNPGTGGAPPSGGNAGQGGGGGSLGSSGGVTSHGGAGGSLGSNGGVTSHGGAGGSLGSSGGAGGRLTFRLPPANATWDYQLGGAYTPPAGVQVLGRDRNSAPVPGLYNLCYINGFQIQPGESSFWTSQHPTLILKDSAGKPVIDADWNETLLDTSTAAKRTELATVLGTWITKCKSDGFDAVDIDNLDSYARSQGLLTSANNVALMSLLSSIAHQQGLAISQKNASDLLGAVAQMGTDFAVVEECNRYGECDAFTAAYGSLVFIVEYRQQDFQTGCTRYPQLSIVRRDLELSTPASATYAYQGC